MSQLSQNIFQPVSGLKQLLGYPLTLGLISAGLFSVELVQAQTAPEPTLIPESQIHLNPANENLLPQIESYNSLDAASDSDTMGIVTNVSQLRDVQPTDWAYQALDNLVSRYGCIAGYPDGTFRGNRALTRYEFAAGLNACLQQIEKLLSTSGDFATKQDLATLQKLVDDFGVELATLRSRVDGLEGRVSFLENHQFSTTTKLEGEVIFGVASLFGRTDAQGEPLQENTVFGNRTRLNFETSFTGEDLLRTRLATGNFPSFAENTFTPEGDLAFAQPDDNDVALEVLLYQFPLTRQTQVTVAASGGAADDFASTVNPFLDGDGATGAISKFATRNPIYYQVEGAGLGIRHQFSDRVELSLGYLANQANEPGASQGLFNGSYGSLAQVVVKPSSRFNLGFTYVHSYNQVDTGTGSNLSNPQALFTGVSNQSIDVPTGSSPFLPDGFNGNVGDLLSDLGFSTDIPFISNSYGVEMSWQLSDRIVLGGWAGYSVVQNLGTGNGLLERGSTDIFNWAVSLAFPDLGKKGNLGGIIVGMEPKVTGSTVRPSAALADLAGAIPLPGALTRQQDNATSLHIEAFYQYQLSENLSITPGVIWLTAPDHNSANNDIVIGTLRTTFQF